MSLIFAIAVTIGVLFLSVYVFLNDKELHARRAAQIERKRSRATTATESTSIIPSEEGMAFRHQASSSQATRPITHDLGKERYNRKIFQSGKQRLRGTVAPMIVVVDFQGISEKANVVSASRPEFAVAFKPKHQGTVH